VKVKVLKEASYEEALLGISLSYDQDVKDMPKVAKKLVHLGGSHAKFLESMVVWIDVIAPRYFHQQLDTYRAGVSKQSGSTMHSITNRKLTQADFEAPIIPATLDGLNKFIEVKDWRSVKINLPEAFLQRRIICTNYKTLARVYWQRKDHRLVEWQVFLKWVLQEIEHPEFILEYGQNNRH